MIPYQPILRDKSCRFGRDIIIVYMNAQIIERTELKLKENTSIPQHVWTFELDGQAREYSVLPLVFSPAIFAGSAWLTTNVLQCVSPNQAFLQIGTGCGVTSIEVCLRVKDCSVSACDINEHAVANAKVNAHNFKADITIKHSDIFQGFKGQKFNVIYWNFPFHPSSKPYSELTILEKAVMDPEYNLLKRFLSEANDYLQKDGHLLLGFSIVMGNIDLLMQLAEERQWKHKEVGRMNEQGLICLIQLEK